MLPQDDLNYSLQLNESIWKELQNAKILLTGGTGFFGAWVLGTLLHAIEKLNLNTEVHVVVRNEEKLRKMFEGYVMANKVKIYAGDITSVKLPELPITHIIHLAAGGQGSISEKQEDFVFDNILFGTRNLLNIARRTSGVRFLYVSSGGAYGKQPRELLQWSEDDTHGPSTITANYASLYGEAKRAAEVLSAAYSEQFGVHVMIARCFAFVGPYLPMTANFAIGNFIHQCVVNQSIQILGDGTPLRSYLYSSDLACWLWTILLKGNNRQIYNVGSDQEISILNLAEKVKNLLNPNLEISVAQKPLQNLLPDRYIPSIIKAEKDLKLKVNVSLENAILKTGAWYRSYLEQNSGQP